MKLGANRLALRCLYNSGAPVIDDASCVCSYAVIAARLKVWPSEDSTKSAITSCRVWQPASECSDR